MIRIQRWLLALLAVSLAINAAGAGLFIYRRYLRDEHRPNHYKTGRELLFATLPVRPEHIVMLGDSLTDWCEWNELLGRADVLNRGVNHDTVAGAMSRLEPILAGSPRQIFLLLGTNDLLSGASVDDVLRDYRALITRIRQGSPRTAVAVHSVLPIRRALAGRGPAPATIRALNTHLESLCSELGCTFVPLFERLAASDGELDPRYTMDGIHLNGQGYAIWREVLKNHL